MRYKHESKARSYYYCMEISTEESNEMVAKWRNMNREQPEEVSCYNWLVSNTRVEEKLFRRNQSWNWTGYRKHDNANAEMENQQHFRNNKDEPIQEHQVCLL